MAYHYPEAIVELRAKLNISQHQLADLFQVSYPSVSRWENGHFEPSKITKIRVDRFLQENGIKETVQNSANDFAVRLDANTKKRLSNYKLEDYVSDVEKLGLEKTWNSICQYSIERRERVPALLETKNFDELYEIGLAVQDKISKKKSGQYFTPDDVAEVMCYWLKGCEGTEVCDVACGTGKLIMTYLDLIGEKEARSLIASGRVYLYDCDRTALKICLTRMAIKYGSEIAKSAHVVLSDFLDRSVVLPKDCKVISNPPYAQIENVRDCWEQTDVLKETRELYSSFMEKIVSHARSTVIITPFGFVSGARFESLRKEMCKAGSGFIVSFDNIPGNIFCGKKYGIFNTNTSNSVRAAITVSHRGGIEKGYRVSPLIRFKNEERKRLLKCDVLEKTLPERRQVINDSNSMFKKINGELYEIFEKWTERSEYRLGEMLFKGENGYLIDMPNTCRYFTVASSHKLRRTGSILLHVEKKSDFDFLYCFINSSFTYWWWRIFDGGITYPLSLLSEMPVPINLLDDSDKDFFSKMATAMIEAEQEYIVKKKNAGAVQESIKFPEEYRKQINDRILKVLGFTYTSGIFRRIHDNRFFEEE